jgi:hypothetical protein
MSTPDNPTPARCPRSATLQHLYDRHVGDDPERIAAYERELEAARAEMAEPSSDAVEILHRRYFEGNPEMLAMLEEERAAPPAGFDPDDDDGGEAREGQGGDS